MSEAKPRIENDNVAAAVALLLTLVALLLVGSIAHPFLLGIGDPPSKTSMIQR